MLVLLRNTSNPIGVTASERATLSDPFFLFSFTNKMTEEVTNFFSERLNPTSTRYDLFEITMPTDVDLPSGNYSYRIYEKSSNSSTDIPDTDPLEIGLAKVPQSGEIDEYFHNSSFFNYVYGANTTS